MLRYCHHTTDHKTEVYSKDRRYHQTSSNQYLRVGIYEGGAGSSVRWRSRVPGTPKA